MYKKILNLTIVVACFVSCILCLIFDEYKNYQYCFVLPILFLIIYITYFLPSFSKEKSPFKIFFCILLFFRYVFLPIGNCMLGYIGSSKFGADSTDYKMGILITIFEIVFLNVFLVLLSKIQKNKKKFNLNNFQSGKGYFILLMFIGAVFGLTLLKRDCWNAIYFIAPSEETSLKFNKIDDISQLIIYLFDIAKQILFLISVEYFAKKYEKSKSHIYFLGAILCMLFNILIYSGTNRADFVITIISTSIIVFRIFPKFKKLIMVGGIIMVMVILPLISSFRKSNLMDDGYSLRGIMELGNMYMSGLDNVALSIKTANSFPEYRRISNLTYDLTRGIMGVGFIVKGLNGTLTSRLFNYSFFGLHSNNTSQIMPMSGQGYFYFGIVGFFLIEALFVFIALKLEKYYREANDIKVQYFLLIILFRLGMLQCLNGTILFNKLSYELVLPLVLFMLNNKITIKRKIKKN